MIPQGAFFGAPQRPGQDTCRELGRFSSCASQQKR
jgi:hypothetical protein